jgi:hypothetical protein
MALVRHLQQPLPLGPHRQRIIIASKFAMSSA